MKDRPFTTQTADFAITLTAGRHARGTNHWQGSPEFSIMKHCRNDTYQKRQYFLRVLDKPRSSRLKLRRKRTPEIEEEIEGAPISKRTSNKELGPEQGRSSSSSSNNSSANPTGVSGSPKSQMLMLRDSIDADAEIQRQMQAGAYNPPWEHTPPPQATFTVELVIPNKQAEIIKAEHKIPPKNS